MPKKKEKDLKSFFSAFGILIRTTKSTINAINQNPASLVDFCMTIDEARRNNKRVHLVGMGRSGSTGMLFGEILKNLGVNVSYLGKSLARPVREGDVVIGFTGSGWTGFTTKALEDSIRRKAKILVFTGSLDSKAGRLADHSIQIPIGYQRELITDSHAPLTPMGTIFELTTMAISIGVASGIKDGSAVKGFNEGTNEVLQAAEMTYDQLDQDHSNLESVISTIESYIKKPKRNIFLFGSGIDGIISNISSIRLNHLKINVRSSYDWRFRKKDDLLIAISGSGESSSTLERVRTSPDMKSISLTSFPESSLALKSDLFLTIEGRDKRVSPDLKKLRDLSFLVPSFEYTAAVTLDSIVAQIALDLGITESQMKEEHANIE